MPVPRSLGADPNEHFDLFDRNKVSDEKDLRDAVWQAQSRSRLRSRSGTKHQWIKSVIHNLNVAFGHSEFHHVGRQASADRDHLVGAPQGFNSST